MTEIAFQAWMYKVDNEIMRIAGVRAEDLGDFDYREAFNTNMSATITAKRALLSNTGFKDIPSKFLEG